MPDPRLDDALAAVRSLNQPVPRPRTLPSDTRVRDVENELGIRLHDDLRRYLLEASDVVYGVIEPITIDGGGHTDLRTVIDDAARSGVPTNLIPICENNGDFFCMEPSGGVVYWSHNGVTDERWPDLAAWITEVWIGTR